MQTRREQSAMYAMDRVTTQGGRVGEDVVIAMEKVTFRLCLLAHQPACAAGTMNFDTTFLAPALSNSISSLSPSMPITVPYPNFV